MNKEMVIFSKTYDFISWLIPQTMNFPRTQRFIVTRRLQDAALDFYELIIDANTYRSKTRLSLLHQADTRLDRVRHYLRLCHNWGWLSPGQYKHAINFVVDMGKLLGGWIKQSGR